MDLLIVMEYPRAIIDQPKDWFTSLFFRADSGAAMTPLKNRPT